MQMEASPEAGLLSPQARYARHTAGVCGYAFRSLDGADGYLFEVSDGGRRAQFAAGAGSPYALNDVRAASIARDKAFCAEVLRGAGVPVLPGRMFFVTERWRDMRASGREMADALRYLDGVEFPVFCKPISASNGVAAEVVESREAFAAYAARVGREHFAVLIQPYISAPEHRVFVLNGKALFSYAKTAPSVRGDGRSTLAELTARSAAARVVFGRGARGRRLSAKDVLAKEEEVFIAGPANRAAGGGATGLRDGAPPALEQLALAATGAIGLNLAGVDIFAADAEAGGLMVIEVNSNPMIATLEDNGRWDLIEAIWRANFEAALR